LTVLLIQNGVHEASGGQPLTNADLDLAQLAQSAGVANARNVSTVADFAPALNGTLAADGPHFLVLATEPDMNVVRPTIAFDPVVTKHRFMTAVGATVYTPTLFGGGLTSG
jgi:thiamine pyrophosphate-dependent acetolactate synthase large subunit-like protein